MTTAHTAPSDETRDQAWQTAFLLDLAEHHDVNRACREADIQRTAVDLERAHNPAFDRLWRQIEAMPAPPDGRTLYRRALAGDSSSASLYLRLHKPDVYDPEYAASIREKAGSVDRVSSEERARWVDIGASAASGTLARVMEDLARRPREEPKHGSL